MRKTGVVLVIAAYALVLYMSLAAPAYARAHPHLDPAILAGYASPWPVALACALSIMGIMVALVPARRGEAWAVWTSLITLTILLITRIVTDPRCQVVLDPHQHGCHTFMIAIVLGVVGLVLVGLSRTSYRSTDPKASPL
jgi:hypothetical protein